MTSLLTNISGLSALHVLTGIQKALTTTEDQASTGLRIKEASDNAAYWSVSVNMKSEVAGLGAASGGLRLLQGIADVTASAVNSVIGLVRSIQQDVVAASQAVVDANAIQKSIAGKQTDLLSIVRAASFNGVNWLTQSAHYTVAETITTNATDAVTQAQYTAMHPGDSWNTTESLDDSFSVTDPAGNVSTFRYAQGSESWVTTVASGLVASSLSRPAPTITTQDNSMLTTGTAIPFSDGQNGTIFSSINLGSFTLLANVDVSTTQRAVTAYTDASATNNSSSSGALQSVGTETIWGDEANPGQAFLNSVLPSSPLTGVLAVNVADPSAASQNRQAAAGALDALTAIAASVGSLQTRIDSQVAFNAALSDALTSGVGSMIDADMSVVSTRLQALQTQQQLGTQMLSIVNQNTQTVLQLFQ